MIHLPVTKGARGHLATMTGGRPIVRFGRTRTMIGVDLYNALNSSAILTYNAAFAPGGAWNTPVTVLTARLAKFSAEITF